MEHDREINFCDYYENWIDMYKIGAIRDITLGKYRMSLKWLRQIAPDLKMNQLTRLTYQKIINEYAETHEIQTTRDFHHHVRACILDALDENLLDRDPTRKAVIKGCKPRKKKQKFLSQFELQKLLVELEIDKRKFHDRIKVGNERKECKSKGYVAFIYEANSTQREQLKKQYGAKLCPIR